jgi:iron(III) transport system permease protein
VAEVGLAVRDRQGFRLRFDVQTIVCSVALALLVLLVVYPLILVVVNSFQVAKPGQPAVWSLEAWRTTLANDRILGAVWNTITLTLARQSISLVVGIFIAWLIARTDIPGRRWLDFLFWVAFFLPALPVTLGWILLLDPAYGLVNQAITALPFGWHGPFDIYSFWGIVWVHLASSSIAIKVILLTPAFRYLDASLEEASRVSGASSLKTLMRISLPVLAPAIIVVVLLSIMHSLQSFEVELILGLPKRFFVFSSQIYLLLHQEPARYAEATVLSTMILGLLVPLILLQRWIVGHRRYVTVAGQFRDTPLALGRWRIPAFLFVMGVALIVTIVPLIMLVLGTFMKLFGFFDLKEPWTLDQWARVLGDPILLTSLRNTLVLTLSVATIGVAIFVLLAYVSVRTTFRLRSAVDFIAWLPSALPGVILGLGLLWMFLATPGFRAIYGTLALLVIALLVAHMTLGVQIIKSSLLQFGVDLEEAARVTGGSWLQGMRRVILPLLTPVVLLVGAIAFVAAARDVSTVVLLATSATRPLSLLQLDYMVEGRYEAAAVVGVLVVILTTGVALTARIVGLRFGLKTTGERVP